MKKREKWQQALLADLLDCGSAEKPLDAALQEAIECATERERERMADKLASALAELQSGMGWSYFQALEGRCRRGDP